MPTYAVTVIPALDRADGVSHTVCLTDVWDIAVDAAQYCVESYPVRYAEYRVELSNHANARVYARWHVLQDSAGARTVCGGFLDGADRERASAQ